MHRPHATNDSRTYVVAVSVVALHLGAGYLAVSSAPQRAADIARQALWARVIMVDQVKADLASQPATEAAAHVAEPVPPIQIDKTEIPVARQAAATDPVPVEVRTAAAAEAVAPTSWSGPAPAAYVPPPEAPPVAFMPAPRAAIAAEHAEPATRCSMKHGEAGPERRRDEPPQARQRSTEECHE